jgi:hypothetical protein
LRNALERPRQFAKQLRPSQIHTVLHQHHHAIGEREEFEKAEQLPAELEDFAPTDIAQLRAGAAASPWLGIGAFRRPNSLQAARRRGPRCGLWT